MRISFMEIFQTCLVYSIRVSQVFSLCDKPFAVTSQRFTVMVNDKDIMMALEQFE